MSEPEEPRVSKAIDSIQQHLTTYACGLSYDSFSPEAVHAAKVRVIDTLGALVGGFFSEPCRIARNLAAQIPNPDGATIIGTRMKTTPEMAAFVNATTARDVELNDVYQWLGTSRGHPSDTLTPLLAVAEYAQLGGRDFITGIILAYEICLRFSDVLGYNPGFDYTNCGCVGTAVGAGKLLRLSPDQLSHCISMAIVPNIVLRQARMDHLSMFKSVAAGYAGRAGVFAALLARAGMEGPHLPFEGKAGWCDHVVGKRFSLDTMGGNGTPFKILDTYIKNRPAQAHALASIVAAERVALKLKSIEEVKQITVALHKIALESTATGEHAWQPRSREDADHSTPYLVAATLIDGTVTLRSYSESNLWNPQLREVMQKIDVVENKEFTNAFGRIPQEQHARVTVVTQSGERLVGESGGDQDDLAAPKSDVFIEEKFRALTEEVLGAQQVNATLDRLWHLEDLKMVAEIAPAFVLS